MHSHVIYLPSDRSKAIMLLNDSNFEPTDTLSELWSSSSKRSSEYTSNRHVLLPAYEPSNAPASSGFEYLEDVIAGHTSFESNIEVLDKVDSELKNCLQEVLETKLHQRQASTGGYLGSFSELIASSMRAAEADWRTVQESVLERLASNLEADCESGTRLIRAIEPECRLIDENTITRIPATKQMNNFIRNTRQEIDILRQGVLDLGQHAACMELAFTLFVERSNTIEESIISIHRQEQFLSLCRLHTFELFNLGGENISLAFQVDSQCIVAEWTRNDPECHYDSSPVALDNSISSDDPTNSDHFWNTPTFRLADSETDASSRDVQSVSGCATNLLSLLVSTDDADADNAKRVALCAIRLLQEADLPSDFFTSVSAVSDFMTRIENFLKDLAAIGAFFGPTVVSQDHKGLELIVCCDETESLKVSFYFDIHNDDDHRCQLTVFPTHVSIHTSCTEVSSWLFVLLCHDNILRFSFSLPHSLIVKA
jgi:hypothetical protein